MRKRIGEEERGNVLAGALLFFFKLAVRRTVAHVARLGHDGRCCPVQTLFQTRPTFIGEKRFVNEGGEKLISILCTESQKEEKKGTEEGGSVFVFVSLEFVVCCTHTHKHRPGERGE